jgi:hypothetical protein
MRSADEDAVRRIYKAWHAAVVARDADAVAALYAEAAVFESPLVWAIDPARQSGVLHGRAAIGAFFAAGFRTSGNGLGRWYRTGLFFSNGLQLVWEYPRETPDGDQVDLVEVMDVAEGAIANHRVYWGWIGVRTLMAG